MDSTLFRRIGTICALCVDSMFADATNEANMRNAEDVKGDGNHAGNKQL